MKRMIAVFLLMASLAIAQVVQINPKALPCPTPNPKQAFGGNGNGKHMPNPPEYYVDGNKIMIVKGKIAGDLKGWLIIEAHNATQFKTNGFDPCYTHIISDYMPMARKLPNGLWEILFTSEIAKDLP